MVPGKDDDEDAWVHSLVANACRRGYTPKEIVRGIERLQKQGWTNQRVAAAFGRSEPWLYGYLKLKDVPDEVLEMMGRDRPDKKRLKLIPAGHIAQIASLPREGSQISMTPGEIVVLQIDLAQQVCDREMSVAAANHYIKQRVRELIGQAVGSGAGSPNRDYRKLLTLGNPVLEKVHSFVDMDADRFRALFESRTDDDLDLLLEDLGRTHRELGVLIEGIASIHDARSG